MKVLITGITGFVGGHLAEHLVAHGGHTLAGFGRTLVWPSDLASLSQVCQLFTADLADSSSMAVAIASFKPDWIIHLAGYANTGKSFKEPSACWEANLQGTMNLYAAVLEAGLRPRILFASTGLVYGDPDLGRIQLDELAPLKPASPYATSKAAADLYSYQMTRSAGMDVVRIRLFNQIGPRQAPDYAVANFARQIAAIEAGKQHPILETGDLSGLRDLTDVRDMVVALRMVLEKGNTGEVYNAGRGEVWRIADVLEELISLSTAKVEVRSKTEPGRGADTAVSRADISKLHALTGWRPRIESRRTLTDILNYWRSNTR
jgi:GDP-4-dehydro-6-deoxy-D-mannose reductase